MMKGMSKNGNQLKARAALSHAKDLFPEIPGRGQTFDPRTFAIAQTNLFVTYRSGNREKYIKPEIYHRPAGSCHH
jgi:hypothetical protein